MIPVHVFYAPTSLSMPPMLQIGCRRVVRNLGEFDILRRMSTGSTRPDVEFLTEGYAERTRGRHEYKMPAVRCRSVLGESAVREKMVKRNEVYFQKNERCNY